MWIICSLLEPMRRKRMDIAIAGAALKEKRLCPVPVRLATPQCLGTALCAV